MTPDKQRWRQVETLYRAALEREPAVASFNLRRFRHVSLGSGAHLAVESTSITESF